MRIRSSLVLMALLSAGCVGVMSRQDHSPVALAKGLKALSATVNATEARRAAECAYTTSARLRNDYRIVGPAIFQNGLVNLGLRRKGLCYHWTEDLLVEMRRLNLRTLEIHWVVSHPGDFCESNALVLTARGQPSADGIVLDAWRHAGDLYWNAVRSDRAFDWHEDHSDYARRKMTEPLPSRRSSLPAPSPLPSFVPKSSDALSSASTPLSPGRGSVRDVEAQRRDDLHLRARFELLRSRSSFNADLWVTRLISEEVLYSAR